MSLASYIAKLNEKPDLSETELYGLLDVELFQAVLRYPAGRVRTNKRQEAGIPDLTLLSDEDDRWVVCEVKLDDDEIRDEARRRRLWQDQAQRYVEPETFYVCLIGPRTFYVCDVRGEIVEGLHIEPAALTDHKGEEPVGLGDDSFRQMLSRITFEEACSQGRYEAFRRGEAPPPHLTLDDENLSRFQAVARYALGQLEPILKQAWRDLNERYEEHIAKAEPVKQRIADAGDDAKARAAAISDLHGLELPMRDIIHIVEDDYPEFRHSQAYAGTRKESEFLDIFTTDTAYIILSRLLFVRICEDLGMISPKVSHKGVAVWQEFMGGIDSRYQDLLEAAFKATKHVYSGLFERTVFDWWGEANGQLSEALERILYRLNAFRFETVDRDVLGTIYESFLPPEKRKQLGEFYTDDEIVDYILWRTGITTDTHLAEKKVLDPACGSFTFGVRAAQHILKTAAEDGLDPADQIERVANVLVGFDVNPFAVFISQMNLIFAVLPQYRAAKDADEDYRLPAFQVYCVNSLLDRDQVTSDDPDTMRLKPQCLAQAYDYVVGNPPYVRNERIPRRDRDAIESAFRDVKYKNTDLAAYFIYRAVRRWLKPEGTLGFVVSLGLANSDATSRLRTQLRDNTILELSSLEWAATEFFRGADILTMLLFVQPGEPGDADMVEVLQGIPERSRLAAATADPAQRESQLQALPRKRWESLSSRGDWCLEVHDRDLALLETLQGLPSLRQRNAMRASFGIKIGAQPEGSALVVEASAPPGRTYVPLVKGHEVAMWGISPPSMWIDGERFGDAADASFWRDAALQGDGPTGLFGSALQDGEVVLLTKIYVTISGSVADISQVCAQDTALVARAQQPHTAHSCCAILNSLPGRFCHLLLLRGGILLRRRSTLYPRTIHNLPCPDLTESDIARLDELSRRAHVVSGEIDTDEADLWAQESEEHPDTIRAAQLVNWTGWGDEEIEDKHVEKARIEGEELAFSGKVKVTGDAATLKLLLWSIEAFGQPPIAKQAAMDVALPRDSAVRERIVGEIETACARRPGLLAELHENIEPEIDEIVMDGLGLGEREKQYIRERCQEFPLSETVMRPRYLWSEDRKKQALRRYEKGTRYR